MRNMLQFNHVTVRVMGVIDSYEPELMSYTIKQMSIVRGGVDHYAISGETILNTEVFESDRARTAIDQCIGRGVTFLANIRIALEGDRMSTSFDEIEYVMLTDDYIHGHAFLVDQQMIGVEKRLLSDDPHRKALRYSLGQKVKGTGFVSKNHRRRVRISKTVGRSHPLRKYLERHDEYVNVRHLCLLHVDIDATPLIQYKHMWVTVFPKQIEGIDVNENPWVAFEGRVDSYQKRNAKENSYSVYVENSLTAI